MKNLLTLLRCLIYSLLIGGLTLMTSSSTVTNTFTNPIIAQDAADPWVIHKDRFYYFTSTLNDDGTLWIWKSRTLTGLDSGEKKLVFSLSDSRLNRQVWAPELHFLRGGWYLYFTASDGVDANHRHYVLEAKTSDPLGEYKEPVLVHPQWNQYAIDGSVLELPDGKLYWMYAANGLWIAPMENPTQAVGSGVRFATGTEDWEHEWHSSGGQWSTGSGYWLEAPQALRHGTRQFVAYSAGHTATIGYYIGLLELVGADPLEPKNWVKFKQPAFQGDLEPDGLVFSTGHNSFTTSADGTEDWIVYHAKDVNFYDFATRKTRLGKITWHADGTPDFGKPIASGVPIPKPSGER